MRISAWLLATLALAGCGRPAPTSDRVEPKPASSAKSDHGAREALPRRVSVSEQVVRAAGIKAKPAVKGTLAETLLLPGEVSADPDRLARISSPAAGRLEEVRFREGQLVKKGETLASV